MFCIKLSQLKSVGEVKIEVINEFDCSDTIGPFNVPNSNALDGECDCIKERYANDAEIIFSKVQS